ncbi:hypothetical protein DI392_00170 [Vibrio albus]|uniref:MotA/TolQ/ExbB proton channel domain-containing protein n=1 Tax=Vibrio albus TaxID=2200953 RepID=A0A2U3BD90_9VIBR|nr:hypothetical protein [Vibrio albus]PWI34737.1 hypothetical protein DI392_00170 [Vibrio albus]
MSNILATLIAKLTASTISDLFLIIIFALFVTSTFFVIKKQSTRLVRVTPNLLTSLGILGTFTGIVVGLMEFDPNNITESIPALLEGLKTAFLTSLFGMFFSILFKGVEGIAEKKGEAEIVNVGPEEIYSVMTQQLSTIQDLKGSTDKLVVSVQGLDDMAEASNKQLALNEELLRAVKGEEDASLTSQIRNMRTDINDASRNVSKHFETQETRHEQFQEKLWSELKLFGELLSKSATEQVINALKDVITDFNNNLTEQFGDNFKRLDESVKKLVDWQENYRVQLEDMQKKYQLGVDAISSTEQSVVHISERAESIPVTMEKLYSVMELGHGQVTELEQRLEAFKDLRDKAVDAMPQIRTQLENTMTEISDSVKAASEHYEQMLEQSSKVIKDFSIAATEGADVLSEKLTTSAQDMGGKLIEASQVFESNAGEASSNMKTMNNELTTAAEQIRSELSDSLSDMNNVMRAMVTGIKEDAEVTSKTLESANIQLVSDTKAMRDESVNAIQQMKERLETSLNEVFQLQAREVQRTFSSLEDQIVKAVERTGSSVESQVEYFDKEMQQEINRTLELMGTELATVTQQFTRDYSKLTNEMSKVVSRSAQGAH